MITQPRPLDNLITLITILNAILILPTPSQKKYLTPSSKFIIVTVLTRIPLSISFHRILVRPVSIYCPKYKATILPWCRVMQATERISEFVDSYLNPLVSHTPSYIQDTTDFLRKLEGIKHQIPNSAFLVTLDVSSLYTNIPHGEGINACAIALRSNNQTKPSVRHLTDLIRHILTKNNFTFLDRNFLQVQGTAMGTKMAPSYANLFMSDLEDSLLSSAPHPPPPSSMVEIYWRYILHLVWWPR